MRTSEVCIITSMASRKSSYKKVSSYRLSLGVANIEERLIEVKRLLGEGSIAEGVNDEFSDQETSNNDESPAEIIN